MRDRLFKITDTLRDNPNSIAQEHVVATIMAEMQEYRPEKVMYAASLVQEQLVIREVSEGVYRRIGHQGLSSTKYDACEALKRTLMDKFQHDMKCVDWQSQQFIKPM